MASTSFTFGNGCNVAVGDHCTVSSVQASPSGCRIQGFIDAIIKDSRDVQEFMRYMKAKHHAFHQKISSQIMKDPTPYNLLKALRRNQKWVILNSVFDGFQKLQEIPKRMRKDQSQKRKDGDDDDDDDDDICKEIGELDIYMSEGDVDIDTNHPKLVRNTLKPSETSLCPSYHQKHHSPQRSPQYKRDRSRYRDRAHRDRDRSRYRHRERDRDSAHRHRYRDKGRERGGGSDKRRDRNKGKDTKRGSGRRRYKGRVRARERRNAIPHII